jgi:N-acetylglucosaminyldiphosphoundecaprenol N-acetyl-beta-D-mannosaminyltransferase
MIDKGRKNVLGVLVDVVDYEAAVGRVMLAASERRPYAVTALAVHGVMTGSLDADQRYRLNQFDMAVPDGQPVRWALNLLHGSGLADRVYGPNLMLAVCEAAAAARLPIYLFGSSRVVLDALARRLTERFPGLDIAGSEPSRFRTITPGERDETITRIKASGAALVFVGLGCPRQEVWCHENVAMLSMPALAVGAAFDFHAGLTPQAPAGMQRWGLEWLYRLVREPRRLWRRYLLLNPTYLALLAAQTLGVWRPDPTAGSRSQEVRYG